LLEAGRIRRTLKVEDPYPMDYQTFDCVAEGVPRFIAGYDTSSPAFSPGISRPRPVRVNWPSFRPDTQA